jgi:Peptidase_C39 like family
MMLKCSSVLYGWTWLYTIKSSDYGYASKKDTHSWHIEKTSIACFSELICSWNAFRPEKGGYFSFWIQARDSVTKNWYMWHQMAQWGKDSSGKNMQRSLVSRGSHGTKYIYVRLELPKYRLADGFRLRIKAHNGASLKNIERVAINGIDLKKFSSESNAQLLKDLPSVYISGVPKWSQMVLNHPRYKSLCSPTSIAMLLGFLLKQYCDPREVARGAYDEGLKVYGNWSLNVAHAFERCKGKVAFHVERLKSFKDLHSHLKQGIPVIVSIRGPLKGAPLPSYTNGHLLVVVGYNKRLRKVLCHDPACSSNTRTAIAYNLNDFIVAWECSKRLAYIATIAY